MRPGRRRLNRGIAGLFLAVFVLMSGCQGSESRDKVDDTVETLSGKQQVERMQDLKKDLDVIQKQQTERHRQLQEDR